MDLWQYIHPDNPIASRVVLALAIGFVIWLLLLLVQAVRVRKQWQLARRVEDVKTLKARLDERISTRAQIADDSARDVPRKPEDDSLQAKQVFADFCRETKMGPRSIVSQHVQSVFMAGWENSQLEIDALIKNTTSRLFRANGFLRSVLSLFIIVGLLGTLFGLAASLAQLPPLMPGDLNTSNQTVAHGLGDLLVHLKGAFAPSIIGVFLTILGVVLFAVYTHFCQAASDHIEYLTLAVWVPKLFPSPFQQQLIGLIQTEDLVRRNREHVEVVAGAAKVIRKDLSGLQKELTSARQTLTALDESSGKINDFADKFQTGVNGLLPFHDQLRSLYDKMLKDSEAFREVLKQSAEASTTLQTNAHQELASQNRRLDEVLSGLRSYEKAYVDKRDEIDANLSTLLKEARNAYSDIGRRNEEISLAIKGAVGDPIREELTTRLTDINEAMSSKLGIIVDRFGTFDSPIKESAKDIRRIASAITEQAERLTGKLQTQYIKQGEANQEQMNRLEALDKRIEGFIALLTDSVSKQTALSTSSTSAVSAVTEKLQALNGNIDLLKQAINLLNTSSKGPDTARLENQIREGIRSLVEELGRIRTAVSNSGFGTTRANPWPTTRNPGLSDNTIGGGLREQKPDVRSHTRTGDQGTRNVAQNPPVARVFVTQEDDAGYFSRAKDAVRRWFRR